jgi:hypothetical protein
MFCRNCGKELTGTPEICTNCGAKPTAGTSFCPACGAPTEPLTEICSKCGVRLARTIKKNTWKTTTAGIIAIVLGGIAVVEWVAVAVLGIFAWGWLATGGWLGPGEILTTVAAIVIAIGIVAIVGGVFALKRKRWGLALAGSICAFFSFFFIPVFLNVPLGIAAIILVVLGKGEFD